MILDVNKRPYDCMKINVNIEPVNCKVDLCSTLYCVTASNCPLTLLYYPERYAKE